MTDTPAKAPTTLRLLVPDDEVAITGTHESPPETASTADVDEYQERGLLGWVRSKVLRTEDIPIAAAQEQLARIDSEVNTLLTSTTPSTVGGFHLKEVQVGVIISAQGSIGIATAGIQASLTLVYGKASPGGAAPSA